MAWAMTWFDVLNCQSERLTIGWPTFFMLANFRGYHLFFRLRERLKSAKRIRSKISVRASQITIARRALSSSNTAR